MRVNRILAGAIVLTFGVALAAAVVVRAQGNAAGRRPGMAFRPLAALNRIGRELNLTPDQKQQIRDLVRSRRDDIKALVDQGAAARQALRRAIASGDNGQITSAVNGVSAVELKGAELAAQLRAKIYSDVLQPDQRSKADQLSAQADQRIDRWRQRIDQLIDSL